MLSGLVPLGADVMRYIVKSCYLSPELFDKCLAHLAKRVLKSWGRRSEIVQQALGFGAQVQTKVSRKVTHVVVSANRTRTQKVRQAAKYPHIKIVNAQWLMDSMSKWQKEDEEPYLVGQATKSYM